MTALYYPARSDYAVQYSLNTGTFGWQAPDAHNTGSGTEYLIDVWLWAGGAGGSSASYGDGNIYKVVGGGGGGGGGFVRASVKVRVGTTYVFSIGTGGNGSAADPRTTVNKPPIRGSAGNNTGISDPIGSIIYATGGQPAVFRGGYHDNFITGGVGGSGVVPQAAKVSSYYIINGGKAENGGTGDPGVPSERTNVAAYGDQPGGISQYLVYRRYMSPQGFMVTEFFDQRYGNYSFQNHKIPGGGGGSAHANGGYAGFINGHGNGSSCPGAGGGAGYYNGGNGGQGVQNGGIQAAFEAGGKGGNGYITFSFLVQDGGNPGIAPA